VEAPNSSSSMVLPGFHNRQPCHCCLGTAEVVRAKKLATSSSKSSDCCIEKIRVSFYWLGKAMSLVLLIPISLAFLYQQGSKAGTITHFENHIFTTAIPETKGEIPVSAYRLAYKSLSPGVTLRDVGYMDLPLLILLLLYSSCAKHMPLGM
jgi:hypothetical protein